MHTDQLNTPRLVADAAGTTVWRWDQQEPFGNNPADEDPDANSIAFDLPLRLPGQRHDQETGLHYNYFRDYDPSIGRYAQSDPAGLVAGLHTFAYVSSRPLTAVDVYGLIGNEPRQGLDPLVACKLINRDPKPDICVDEAKCCDQVLKALTKCELQYWSPKKKIACITCWRYIEGLCPGLDPGPECDRLACIVPSISPDPDIPTLGV